MLRYSTSALVLCLSFVDVFSVSDLAGLPPSLIVADRVPLSFSIAVHNVDRSMKPIAPSINGQPLFSFEVSMVQCFPNFMGGGWAPTLFHVS